jgi:hypothetical protein
MRQPVRPVGNRTIADVIAESKARMAAEQKRAAEDVQRRREQAQQTGGAR